jgi:hypothetical protein
MAENGNVGEQPAAIAVAAASPVASKLHLTQFWTDAPHAWFHMAEAQFH